MDPSFTAGSGCHEHLPFFPPPIAANGGNGLREERGAVALSREPVLKHGPNTAHAAERS